MDGGPDSNSRTYLFDYFTFRLIPILKEQTRFSRQKERE
jgi:hypothetical protein